jgi:NAD(P)H-dependent flavin oxidoreductase YrpB (nitropropane dioxygenase family)
VRTKSLTGKPVRALRTPLEDAWGRADAPPTLPAPQQGLLMRPLIRRAFQHNIEPLMGSAVGQVVGLMNERRTCRTLVNEIMNELVETLDRVEAQLSE